MRRSLTCKRLARHGQIATSVTDPADRDARLAANLWAREQVFA
jgi:hypothetical protein